MDEVLDSSETGGPRIWYSLALQSSEVAASAAPHCLEHKEEPCTVSQIILVGSKPMIRAQMNIHDAVRAPLQNYLPTTAASVQTI